jgi:MFS family permease
VGRKRMLLVGAALMIFAGVVFALTGDYLLLTLAAVIGVISPSGNEIGPFLSIEQAALTQIAPNAQRTRVFAWYNMIGSFATARPHDQEGKCRPCASGEMRARGNRSS